MKLWSFYYYPWKLRYGANNSPCFSLHDEHRVGKHLRMRVEHWRSLGVNKKILKKHRKETIFNGWLPKKNKQHLFFFTKNQTHSRWFRQKINSSRSRNELCRSYYGYHICSLKFPQGSKHLQTMVMDGKCFTQEVIGHPNHHVRLDAYGCPLYLVNGLSHPI